MVHYLAEDGATLSENLWYWLRKFKGMQCLNITRRDAEIHLRGDKEMQLIGVDSCDGETVLDIGPGDGAFFPFYISRNLKVIGLDINLRNLKMLRRSYYSTVSLIHGDAHKLPLTEGSTDIVFMCEVLEHLADPLSGLKEAYRVLKPNGHLVVDVPYWNQLCRPLSIISLRQLQDFKSKRKMPPLFRALFRMQDSRLERRTFTNLIVRLGQLFPTFKGINPEAFIEEYLSDKVQRDVHLHFYFPSEWCRFVKEANFEIRTVSGTCITPPPLNRFGVLISLFGKVEQHLPDSLLARISQALIIEAVKPG